MPPRQAGQLDCVGAGGGLHDGFQAKKRASGLLLGAPSALPPPHSCPSRATIHICAVDQALTCRLGSWAAGWVHTAPLTLAQPVAGPSMAGGQAGVGPSDRTRGGDGSAGWAGVASAFAKNLLYLPPVAWAAPLHPHRPVSLPQAGQVPRGLSACLQPAQARLWFLGESGRRGQWAPGTFGEGAAPSKKPFS